MTTYDRWYLVPQEETTDSAGNTYNQPKYSDKDGIAGFSGNTVNESIVNDRYPALIDVYPDVNTWYIVRMYGIDNAGWEALNEVSVLGDTRNLASNPEDVKAVLNERFPALGDRTANKWAESFKVSN